MTLAKPMPMSKSSCTTRDEITTKKKKLEREEGLATLSRELGTFTSSSSTMMVFANIIFTMSHRANMIFFAFHG
jgi:hypothetical protein